MSKSLAHKIFIGWDSRQEISYDVCAYSIKRRASCPIEIFALKQADLRAQGLYSRAADPLASTEFTYTRFLVPQLTNFSGWALFVDSDFLFLNDISELLNLADSRYALMCVKHDHRPSETVKMDGCVQTSYPRKNWSSLMLINCGHPKVRVLNAKVVNEQSPAYLHRFHWLEDSEIGSLPSDWNWLEGWSSVSEKGKPKAIHYTRGGPWFKDWGHVQYADLWLRERDLLSQQQERDAEAKTC